MTDAPIDAIAARKPIRLWPGVVIVIVQWLVRFILPKVVPDSTGGAVFGGIAAGLALVVWWLFFSRVPWPERVGVLVLMVAALFATSRVVHPSIANGMMGMMLPIYAIPLLSLALVVWAIAFRRLSPQLSSASLVGVTLFACGIMTLVRTGGITGDAVSDLHWRWSQTPEERLLALAGGTRPAPVKLPSPNKQVLPQALDALKETNATADWPGFRGADRDGIVRGVRLASNWSSSPPVELWRQPIGPGWSSFAVHGNFVYTQEQRGEDESISCYDLATGAPVWRHSDAARFWESNAGPGPRGTPTFRDGHLYAFGATGILNALDAANGAVIWSRNAASDTHKKIPGWGFASSPLVVNDLVIIATAGVLAAYDIATGGPRWQGPPGGWGYSSPHLATIGGVSQVLLLNGAGAIGVAPADGKVLWSHEWKGDGIVQPVVLADGDILIGSGSGMGGKVGVRRIAVTNGTAGWSVEERWTSTGLKPYFNDFVVHKGHAFGFDGTLLACIDLNDGARKWKGGRYGGGQLILLPDQDLLLVLSEQGELALVEAVPDHHNELTRSGGIEGKTWNHPVLVGDVLLVRNSEMMAAFRLKLAER